MEDDVAVAGDEESEDVFGEEEEETYVSTDSMTTRRLLWLVRKEETSSHLLFRGRWTKSSDLRKCKGVVKEVLHLLQLATAVPVYVQRVYHWAATVVQSPLRNPLNDGMVCNIADERGEFAFGEHRHGEVDIRQMRAACYMRVVGNEEVAVFNFFKLVLRQQVLHQPAHGG